MCCLLELNFGTEGEREKRQEFLLSNLEAMIHLNLIVLLLLLLLTSTHASNTIDNNTENNKNG